MKILLIIFCIQSYNLMFGQFAVINDGDSYVNIRSAANTESGITTRLNNGEVVFCREPEGNWYPVNYNVKGKDIQGYIYKSKAIFIESFTSLPYADLTDNMVLFNAEGLQITVTITAFNPKANKLQYKGKNSEIAGGTIVDKINGKEIWGTDGYIPKMQYKQIAVLLDTKKINLPVDNLFEPNLELTAVNYDSKSKTIYISASNGDGSAGYDVIWIIEDVIFKKQFVTNPF